MITLAYLGIIVAVFVIGILVFWEDIWPFLLICAVIGLIIWAGWGAVFLWEHYHITNPAHQAEAQ